MYKNKQNFNNLTSHQIIDYYQVSINKILVPLQIRTDNHDIIDNIGFNEKFKTIFLFINPSISTTNKILIEIPRAILDSKTIEGKDKNFNVTINNKPAKFLEVNDTNRSASHNFTDNEEKSLTENLNANANNRNLLIEFDKNSKVIEITGTNLSIFKNVKQNVEKPTEEMIPIKSNNQKKYLNFNIDGGQLIAAFLSHDKTFKAINLLIHPSFNKGNIDIEIPRAILDSKTIEGKDKNFNVTINNKPAKFLEVNDTNRSASHNFTDNEEKSLTENLNANANNRNLLIEFDKNSKVIEITGTNLSIFKNVKQNVEKPTEENTKIITSIVSIIIGIVIGLTYFIIRKRDISFIKKFRANK